ncbi:MAG: chromosome segregation protein ScpA [Bryobacterales bacterium]|nr:chromosome segregation protein ScpA [Bryobacterales bacterium]
MDPLLSCSSVPPPLNFHLEHYDGPLDLLLDLIRKQEIDIYNIPIAQITSQYLEYMTHALKMDIELSAEFVYMAATLIQIKSKVLLPRDPALQEISPEDDPRQELVDRLLEHERFKSAAEMLHQKRVVEEAVWSNPRIEEFRAEDDGTPGLAVTLHDLVKTFQGVLERAKNRPVYEIDQEDVSVPDMIRYMRTIFEKERRNDVISARELFERQKSRRAMICLFLALLELVKLQAVGLTQADAFGEIGLKRLKGFDGVFAQETTMTVINEGYL